MVSWAFRYSFGTFFFQTAGLVLRIAMVGSNHHFHEMMGRLGWKGILGHNLGLEAQKSLAMTHIVLKWEELLRGRKQRWSVTVDFNG